MVLFALLCMQISLPTLLKYLLVTRLQQRNAGMRSLLNPRDIRSGLQIQSVKCVCRSKGDNLYHVNILLMRPHDISSECDPKKGQPRAEIANKVHSHKIHH